MRKRTWMIILTAIAVLVVAGIVANVVLKSVIEKKLRTSLQQFQPFVQAGFSKAHVDLFAASVQIDSLYILINSELKQQHQHSLNFSGATISDIHFFKLITSKNFSAGLLQLKNAKIKLDHYLLGKKDTIPSSLFKKVNMPFKNILIGKIEIHDAVIVQKDNNRTDTICNGSISISDVQIPKIDTSFSKDSIHFSNIVCDLNDITNKISPYYTVHLKKFHVSSRDSVMQIDSLKLIPLLGKYEMGEKAGKQVDHINASVNKIAITGLNVKDLMQKKFIAKEINIGRSVTYVFRDRRLPLSQQKQPTTMDYLKQIPFDLHVEKFDLNDATVTSEEFPKKGVHSGYIKLEHLYINMKPFKNHADKSSSSLISNVKASIMGAGNINATINLSLLTGSSEIKGVIDELNLPAMNPSAENLGQFHVESGVLNRLDFEFTATNEKATGQIVGVYHDLVVDKLKLTDDGLKKAKLPSFLLHHLIIPKNKDASLDVKKRTGKIDYDRDPTRLVTFYYLKALLDGIRDSFALGFVLPK